MPRVQCAGIAARTAVRGRCAACRGAAAAPRVARFPVRCHELPRKRFMDSDIMRIGQRIRRLRREAKKTLLEVATEAHLSVGFLSQVERNLTGISLSSLVNVANALKVPLGTLIDQPRQAQPDSHAGRREPYALDAASQWYERLSTTFDGSQINALKVRMMEATGRSGSRTAATSSCTCSPAACATRSASAITRCRPAIRCTSMRGSAIASPMSATGRPS
jgi:transcriptional regulator with XRE-family HTH domain